MNDVSLRDISVPAIGYGTWLMRGYECERAVSMALDVGYRHIDTAQMYGNEDRVGAALRGSGLAREDVFLTSKVWYTELSPARVRAAVEGSLQALRVPYLDLLLIHWPNPSLPLERTLDAMAALQEEGKTRQIGVSNFPPALFARAVAHMPVFCNQVEYHPYLSQEPLLRLARDHDALLTAYAPLARGKVLDEPVLQEIGERHGKNPAQTTLRWLIQQENVAAIPKASQVEHMQSNLDVFDFELSAGDMARIADLARGERLVSPDFAPAWGT